MVNTILTDDERPELPSPVYGPDTQVDEDSDGAYTVAQMEAYADAREAAVLAKLAQQEPVAWQWRKKDQAWSLDRTFNSEVYATTADSEVRALYTHPAPQQADRHRVPDGVLAAIYRAGFSLVKTADAYELMRLGKVEAQVAAPEAPAQEKSNG